MISCVLTALLLAQVPNLPVLGPAAKQNPIVNKAKEREELITKLKRDIFKVDRSIGETEKLIQKSRNAPYLPDLQFRLAELYVEKSRYMYYLQAEQRPPEMKGALVSPETKLLKQKAVQIYYRILREFPDFKDGDKVTFYLAHEQRELGQFDDMLKTEGDLIRKYPNSPLRLDAEQILGDYFFDKADLVEAEKHYQAILEQPPSPVHDLARYKMGWIRVNQSKHAEAVVFFEAAAASPPIPGVDPQKSLNVKREALLDLVYSYTEVRPAKGALNYFEKLSDSRATYALALDKLGNRYFIKTQYEYAIPALRKLMEIQPDPELDLERAEKIYDSLKAAKGKVPPKPDDIRYLVRAAIEAKTDPEKDEGARKKTLAELEEMSRDLATQMHVAAQKKEEKGLFLEAADAYKEYLSLFRPEAYVRTIMRNRGDALFAAKEFPEAARQFEELALYEERALDKAKNGKADAKAVASAASQKANKDAPQLSGSDHESALYAALLAHFSALKPGEVERLNAFEVADARQALKLLGARFVAQYPKSENVTEVKFNIARAYYEDGDYEKSSELFADFAINHPDHKDAAVAGNLALDGLRQRNDFKGMEELGKKFLASRLPAAFQNDVRKILTESKGEALSELALQSSQETGDVVEGLLKVAEENKGAEIGEKALYGAFVAAREKRDVHKEKELGDKFVKDYPKSQYNTDILTTLGRNAAETAKFEEAASYFEAVGQKLGADSAGLDGWLAGARLRLALGQFAAAQKDFEFATEVAGARKAEVLTMLAEAELKGNQNGKARATLEQALKLDKQNAKAAGMLAELVATTAPNEKPEALISTLTTVTQGPDGQSEDSAKGLWYLGEMLYRGYKALPNSDVEQKVQQLQSTEQVYMQAAQMGSPEWAVASLWRIALAYQHLADVVEATPVPAGLSAAEVQQFRKAVAEQVNPLRDRADNAFKACLQRATQLEVFTPAVLGCRTRKEDASSPLPKLAGGGSPSNLDDLQKKVEATQDAASVEALGLAYLEAKQVALAELAFGRATELEDTRASAHNALGVALLLSGDAMGARASYGKALDSDPTNEKARANLAALRCRFGDVEGAKRELSVLKDVGQLSGPDVDPEWRACK
ncbi:MAG: tetratricopeptide repeat protein [Myxococcaceae bacterium]